MTHTIGVFASLFDADGRIVLVRQSYAGQCWAQPGGRLEPRETPTDGLLREIREETGMQARVDAYVGTYAAPYRDDLVLHFRASVVARSVWAPCGEIIGCESFEPHRLPEPMRPFTRARIADALEGRSNVFRTHLTPDEMVDL